METGNIERMTRPELFHQLAFVTKPAEYDSLRDRPTEELKALLMLRRS